MRVGSAGIALCLVVAMTASVSSETASASPPCDERSWTGGTTEWCDGRLVYRDYIYDDDGADTTEVPSVHGTSLSRASGDVDHREHGQQLNSADLLTLRVLRDGDELLFTFVLNTLFRSDRTLAAVAIDTDGDRSTGGGRWGGGRLGRGINVSSSGWDELAVFSDRHNSTNTISGSMPLPDTRSKLWRIQAVVALGDGTPMNVAFRPDETGNWWEDAQSDALATGDISAFGHTFPAAELLTGRTHRPATAAPPGLRERIYTSKYAIGEGVDYDGVQLKGVRGTYGYLGPHQPYAIFVPKPDRTKKYGMQLALHGLNAAHASLVSRPGMQFAFGDYLRSLGDRPRLIVVPLGRGPAGSYVDYSERDVLDVIADVKRNYRVDASRVFAGGYSMGGGGTYWMSSLHPDLFAGAINWVGYTGDCLNGTPIAQGRQRPDPPTEGAWGNEPGSGCNGEGNVLDYLDGARHVPMAMLYAGGDELVWANHATALMQRYAELEYEHVMWFHPAAEHLTFALLDNWLKEAEWSANRTRVLHPAHVTFRTNPYVWFTKAGLRHDSAYWVRNLVPAKPSRDRLGDVSVDLISHRCSPNATYGSTVSYGAGPAPLPWISQEGVPKKLGAIPQESVISGSITNAREITIDAKGACMGRDRIGLDIAVDGPTVVHFTDGRPDEILRP